MDVESFKEFALIFAMDGMYAMLVIFAILAACIMIFTLILTIPFCSIFGLLILSYNLEYIQDRRR